MASYSAVKRAAVDVVDDSTRLDVTANYAPSGSKKYNAKTKLEKIGVNEFSLAGMPLRLNKVMENLTQGAWITVGSIDTAGLTTIGDVILLACANSGTKVPFGEPT